MFKYLLLSAALYLFLTGCAVTVQPDQRRTLAGMSKTETIVAAGHALSLEGFNLESIDMESGKIVTDWESNARKKVQYTVVVKEKNEDEGVALIEVTASASAVFKTAEGWGEPLYHKDRNLDNILEKIVSISAHRYDPQHTFEFKNKHEPCDNSNQCQSGYFCGSQMCVYECTTDAHCDEERKCDERGRCILPLPVAQEITDSDSVISPPPLPKQKQTNSKTNDKVSSERSDKNDN